MLAIEEIRPEEGRYFVQRDDPHFFPDEEMRAPDGVPGAVFEDGTELLAWLTDRVREGYTFRSMRGPEYRIVQVEVPAYNVEAL